MFSAAQIIFNNRSNPTDLDKLMGFLAKVVTHRVSKTQWVGFSTAIPQLLVETTPPFTIQIEDDPGYVPEEIAEIVDNEEEPLSPSQRERLRQCNVRLDVMSTVPPPSGESSSGIFVIAQTNLDPSLPVVAHVLESIAKHLNGFVVDCVNGGIREPLA